MLIKKLIPKSLKALSRQMLRGFGYDLVYLSNQPGTFHRYPYASQTSFFQDLKGRGYSPARVIDIGANHGSWSKDLLNVFPAAQGLLVEPQVECQSALDELRREHPGWKVAQVGAAGENGTRRFQACSDTVSSSFLSATDKPVSDKSIRELTVMTLDHLSNEYFTGETINIVKIDAEGLELEILAGGEKTVRGADIVMLEVAFFEFNAGQPRFFELVQLMNQYGFSIYDFSMFHRRPYDGALGLMDCVFASNSSVLRKSHAW